MSYKSGNRAGGKFGGKKRGGSSFGGGGGFGGRDSGRSELHKTNCSECQKPCEVPFKPNGLKPVYCRSCFKNHDGESAPRESRGEPREGARRDFGGKSFGRAADIIQRSTSERFGSSSAMTSDQFQILNTKLDEILDALDAISHTR